MILKLNTSVSANDAAQLAEKHKAFHIHYNGSQHLITSSSMKEVPNELAAKVEESWVFANDMQLASRAFQQKTREIKIRSEEHTSELQSRPHLVCRLLLEKKK